MSRNRIRCLLRIGIIAGLAVFGLNPALLATTECGRALLVAVTGIYFDAPVVPLVVANMTGVSAVSCCGSPFSDRSIYGWRSS